jgi:hypothetical protein
VILTKTAQSFHKPDAVTPQTTRKENIMPDFPTVLKGWVSDGRQQRELSKLECGLLGALLASIALAFLFWLNVQFSLLTLLIQTT